MRLSQIRCHFLNRCASLDLTNLHQIKALTGYTNNKKLKASKDGLSTHGLKFFFSGSSFIPLNKALARVSKNRQVPNQGELRLAKDCILCESLLSSPMS